jgi:hypothetical protein
VFFQARHGFTQLNFTYKLYNGCKWNIQVYHITQNI